MMGETKEKMKSMAKKDLFDYEEYQRPIMTTMIMLFQLAAIKSTAFMESAMSSLQDASSSKESVAHLRGFVHGVYTSDFIEEVSEKLQLEPGLRVLMSRLMIDKKPDGESLQELVRLGEIDGRLAMEIVSPVLRSIRPLMTDLMGIVYEQEADEQVEQEDEWFVSRLNGEAIGKFKTHKEAKDYYLTKRYALILKTLTAGKAGV